VSFSNVEIMNTHITEISLCDFQVAFIIFFFTFFLIWYDACRLGLKVALADIDEQKLHEIAAECSETLGENNVLTIPTDVSQLDQVVRLRDRVYEAWGEVILSVFPFCFCP